MVFKYINMECYTRLPQFKYFRTLQYPYVGVTVNIDITDALRFSKDCDKSFYLTVLHLVALAADGVPAFRQRIRGEQIIEYSECPTSHIEAVSGENYCYCTLYHHMNLNDYFAEAEKARRNCGKNGITEDSNVESMYFISTLPWLHYSALIQPVAGGDESNPRISWGKYEDNRAGRTIMPLSVLAHHALVDGIHIAQFYKNLNDEIVKLTLTT